MSDSFASFASIDIGTNSVLCLIARGSLENDIPHLETIEDHATLTRLGEGLASSENFLPQAIERTISALGECRKRIEHHRIPKENIFVVGTAGMRRGKNAQDFITRVQRDTQLSIEIIDGDREAYLNYLTCVYGLKHEPDRDLLLMDIGGGSTEYVRGSADFKAGGIQFAKSLHLGSVWLTERCLKGDDPPTPKQFAPVTREIDRILDEAEIPWHAPVEFIGIAGTITTLYAVSHQVIPYDATKVHGKKLTGEEIKSLLERMMALPLEKRAQLPGLQKERADVILAGASIALQALQRTGCPEMTVCDQGIRNGMLYEALLKHA